MKLARALAFALLTTTLAAQTPINTAKLFAASLREFVTARDKGAPPHVDEEKVFAYRAETMVLYRKSYQRQCEFAAKGLAEKGLVEFCTTVDSPHHLTYLVEAFEMKTRSMTLVPERKQ